MVKKSSVLKNKKTRNPFVSLQNRKKEDLVKI